MVSLPRDHLVHLGPGLPVTVYVTSRTESQELRFGKRFYGQLPAELGPEPTRADTQSLADYYVPAPQ